MFNSSSECVVEEERIDKVLKNSELERYDLANVPDFNSLIAISQKLSKPIFALNDDEIGRTGNVFGHAMNTMMSSRDSFKECFQNLAERIHILTE